MHDLISNNRSEKPKVFHIRVMRNLFSKIVIVWTFPDHLIVFGEKKEQKHIDIWIVKPVQWSKSSSKPSISRNLFPSVFDNPF